MFIFLTQFPNILHCPLDDLFPKWNKSAVSLQHLLAFIVVLAFNTFVNTSVTLTLFLPGLAKYISAECLVTDRVWHALQRQKGMKGKTAAWAKGKIW